MFDSFRQRGRRRPVKGCSYCNSFHFITFKPSSFPSER